MSAGDGPLHVRVLTVNCGPASEYLERATVPEACESVVALAQELKPDVLLLQEFRCAAGGTPGAAPRHRAGASPNAVLLVRLQVAA